MTGFVGGVLWNFELSSKTYGEDLTAKVLPKKSPAFSLEVC
jgi:hypothetical protein